LENYIDVIISLLTPFIIIQFIITIFNFFSQIQGNLRKTIVDTKLHFLPEEPEKYRRNRLWEKIRSIYPLIHPFEISSSFSFRRVFKTKKKKKKIKEFIFHEIAYKRYEKEKQFHFAKNNACNDVYVNDVNGLCYAMRIFSSSTSLLIVVVQRRRVLIQMPKVS